MAATGTDRPYAEITRAAEREGTLPPDTENAIRVDVPRTYFAGRSPPGPEESQRLRRLLRALALWDPELAYCQGMNFIVAFALLASCWACPTEEADPGDIPGSANHSAGAAAAAGAACPGAGAEADAFWLVGCILRSYGARGLFLQRTPLLKLYSFCLSRLIQRRLPEVFCLLNGLDEVLGFKWFGTLFTTVLPPEATVRAWDLLFHDGLTALLRLALGLCSLMAPALRAGEEDGEDVVDVVGHFQRQLPVDGTLLLPPGRACDGGRQATGCDELGDNSSRDRNKATADGGGARALGVPDACTPAQSAGDCLMAAVANYPCDWQELEALLLEWRRECPDEAADIGESFSFCKLSL